LKLEMGWRRQKKGQMRDLNQMKRGKVSSDIAAISPVEIWAAK